MSLEKQNTKPSALSWLNKGWKALREHAHESITHFRHQDAVASSQENTDEFLPGTWGLMAADVSESNNMIEVRLEVPGMAKQDFDIEMQSGLLRVSGEKRMGTERKEGGCHITERAFGHFCRTVRIPTTVDVEHVQARYEDGVLIVRMPKSDEPDSTRVAIR